MLLNGVYTIKLVPFLVFFGPSISSCSFFVVILVLFVALGPWDVLNGVFIIKLVLFWFFWPFNFFDVHFSWEFSCFSLLRDPGMLLNGVYTLKLVHFVFFLALQLLRFSFFVLILVLFRVLQHPAEELMSIFRGNSRTYFSVFCNIRPKNFSV